MEAEIRECPASFRVEVYLFVRRDAETIICNLDGSEKQRLPFGSAEAAEPSFVADRQTVEALVGAASDFLPPSQATDRHLADAIKVRDRLMDAYLPTGGAR